MSTFLIPYLCLLGLRTEKHTGRQIVTPRDLGRAGRAQGLIGSQLGRPNDPWSLLRSSGPLSESVPVHRTTIVGIEVELFTVSLSYPEPWGSGVRGPSSGQGSSDRDLRRQSEPQVKDQFVCRYNLPGQPVAGLRQRRTEPVCRTVRRGNRRTASV